MPQSLHCRTLCDDDDREYDDIDDDEDREYVIDNDDEEEVGMKFVNIQVSRN